jgi:hypothetical protein
MKTSAVQTKPMILSRIRPIYLLKETKATGFGVKLWGRESKGMALSGGCARVGDGRSKSDTIGFWE